MGQAGKIAGIGINRPPGSNTSGYPHKIRLCFTVHPPLMGHFVGNGLRLKSWREVHIHVCFPCKWKIKAGKADETHKFGKKHGFRPQHFLLQQRKFLLHCFIQPLGILEKAAFRKMPLLIPGNPLGIVPRLLRKILGHLGQFLYGHTC